MLRATVLWQVFELTRSPAALGLVGLVQFLPVPFASLAGGVAADTRDRRKIVLAAQTLLAVAGSVLALSQLASSPTIAILYVVVVLVAVVAAFEAPSRSATLSTLVPADELQGAITVFVTAQSVAFLSGPALAGLAIAAGSAFGAFAASAALFVLSALLTTGVRGTAPARPASRPSLASLWEGLRFLRARPVLLGAMSLDLFAVIFGGATALLPVFATDILEVGPRGYGLLTAALEVGALSMALALLARRPFQRVGKALVASVVVFGLATMVFGLSRSFPLSLAAYAIAGAADQVSVVVRSTLVQESTPDELRGRVSSVNLVFIGASNQLGAAESGFLAALTSPTFSVVFGGAMCLVVTAVVALLVPALVRAGERAEPPA